MIYRFIASPYGQLSYQARPKKPYLSHEYFVPFVEQDGQALKGIDNELLRESVEFFLCKPNLFTQIELECFQQDYTFF